MTRPSGGWREGIAARSARSRADQEITELREAIARVRELHSRSESGNCNGGCTDGLDNPIPHDECPTIAALNGTDGDQR